MVFKTSFKIAAIIGLLSATLVGLTGHAQAQHMVATQPMKMAAAEMLYESEDPAGLSIITIGGEDPIIDLRIPGALSFLSYNRFTGEVQGINPLQEELAATYGADDYSPPVGLMYWSFRIMVFSGSAMVCWLRMVCLWGERKNLACQTGWGRFSCWRLHCRIWRTASAG